MHAALGFLSSKAFNEKGGTLDMILELHLVLLLRVYCWIKKTEKYFDLHDRESLDLTPLS